MKVQLFLMFFMASASFVSAQNENKTEFYINGGMTFPFAPNKFSDYWNKGFNFGGGIGYLINPNLSFVGNVNYNTFSFNDEEFLNDYGFGGYGITISGADASIITVSWNLKTSLQPITTNVRPYLCGGIGYFRLSKSDVTVSLIGESETVEGDSESAVSVLFGGGTDFKINENMDFFIEFKYTIGFTEGEKTTMLPLKLGVKFR